MFNEVGRILVGLGILLVIVGVVFLVGNKLGIGKLPGDILIRRGNFTFFFPIVTCIIISIILSIISIALRR